MHRKPFTLGHSLDDASRLVRGAEHPCGVEVCPMRTDNVQTRHENGRELPAVNVKLPPWHWPSFPMADAPGLTLEIAEREGERWSEYAIEQGWEMLSDYARDQGWTVFAAGRSGGWAVVEGLPPLDEWTELEHLSWGDFTRYCEAVVRDLPYQTAMLIYLNVVAPERVEAQEAESALRTMGIRTEA